MQSISPRPVHYAAGGMTGCLIYLMAPAGGQGVMYVLFPAAAAILAFRRGRRDERSRSAWILLGIAFALLASADGLYQIRTIDSAFPGPADVLYVAGFVVAIAAAVKMRDRHQRQRNRYLIRMVDACIIAVSVTYVIWMTWVDPAAALLGPSITDKLLALSYPMLGLTILTVLVSGGRLQGFRLWLVAALVLLIAGDLWYSIAALNDTYQIGMWPDLLWLGAYVGFGSASLSPATDNDPPEVVQKGRTRVLVVSSLMMILLVFSYHAVWLDHTHAVVTALAVITVTGLVLLRLEMTQRWLMDALQEAAASNEEVRVSLDGAESLRRQYQLILDSVAEGIIEVDESRAVVLANLAALSMLSYPPTELMGLQVDAFLHHSGEQEGQQVEQSPVQQTLRKGTSHHAQNQLLCGKDGTTLRVDYTATPIRDANRVAGAVITIRDITGYVALEEQFRQSQKLEAIGQLAGGVAHDFNNLLTVILTYTHLVQEDLDDADPRKEDIGGIAEATERAVALVRQLLAFSRKDLALPEVVDVGDAVANIEELLKRVIGEDIDLQLTVSPDPANVLIDPGHLEQVLMNLAVNARDAMPDGGIMTLTTSHNDAGAVVLEVNDTGCGMDKEVQSHLFEPFFTTKGQGEGTGLGLATVHGIVTQAAGFIEVDSMPGRGTTFRITFPSTTADPVTNVEQRVLGDEDGTESIVLIEDEDLVRRATARLLESAGYAVTAVAGPKAAIELADRGLTFDLVLTDMVMPGMSGPEVAGELVRRNHRGPIIFMSGYANQLIEQRGGLPKGHTLLRKPFTRSSLLHAVRRELNKREEMEVGS